jgi:hypothetical protein
MPVIEKTRLRHPGKAHRAVAATPMTRSSFRADAFWGTIPSSRQGPERQPIFKGPESLSEHRTTD